MPSVRLASRRHEVHDDHLRRDHRAVARDVGRRGILIRVVAEVDDELLLGDLDRDPVDDTAVLLLRQLEPPLRQPTQRRPRDPLAVLHELAPCRAERVDPVLGAELEDAALADAGVGKDEIDYVHAHATSTPIGDASETKTLKLALGEENAYKTPVSGTKGATGHCLGAAGAIEAMFTVLAVRDGKLPPTINYDVPDPECDLDYVPNEARDADVKVAVSNSFGFGGHNACVVFRRYDG